MQRSNIIHIIDFDRSNIRRYSIHLNIIAWHEQWKNLSAVKTIDYIHEFRRRKWILLDRYRIGQSQAIDRSPVDLLV
jgi:hypothetical protein